MFKSELRLAFANIAVSAEIHSKACDKRLLSKDVVTIQTFLAAITVGIEETGLECLFQE